MAETEIRTEIDIAAEPPAVWRVLTDLGGYDRWNPMVISAQGVAAEGGVARLRYRSSIGLELRFQVRITRFDPPREFRWVGSRLGVSGDHYFRLEPIEGGTRLIHGEVFRGRLAGVLAGSFRRQLPVFERFDRALKTTVEAQGR